MTRFSTCLIILLTGQFSAQSADNPDSTGYHAGPNGVQSATQQGTINITSWNLEHFGSPGRGFGSGYGGFGRGSIPERFNELPPRTTQQLQAIATFIQNDLGSDIIALQELGITSQRLGRSLCAPLNEVVNYLEQQKGNPSKWAYFIPQVEVTPPEDDEKNVNLGFLWNQKKVRLQRVFEMSVGNQILAGKELFERKPLVAYFETILPDGSGGMDFVLVNVHLASGQDRDENHLIAMTLIEYQIQRDLASQAVSEPAIVILGDYNDNPARVGPDGASLTSPALVEHLKFKGYTDLTAPEMKFTRMDARLSSLIDHVWLNQSAYNLLAKPTATINKPGGGLLGKPELFAEWRLTFSDHFPITFQLLTGPDNDPDFFD